MPTPGRYKSLMLHKRVHQRPLPEVTTINLAEEDRIGDGIFTQPMVTAIEETLANDEQIILFQNRRGYAPYVSCRDCGHAFRCDSCDVSLTLHRRREILQCHYCGFETQAPDECPSCGGHRVGSFGVGVERIETELESNITFSAHSTAGPGSHSQPPRPGKSPRPFSSRRIENSREHKWSRKAMIFPASPWWASSPQTPV